VNTPRFKAGVFLGLLVVLGTVSCATNAPSSTAPSSSTGTCEGVGGDCATENVANSCREFASALTTASAGVVNAFAVVESDSNAFVLQLKGVREGFDNARSHWSPTVEAAATSFGDELDLLIAEGQDAIGNSGLDSTALSEAASKFQLAATDALATCSGDEVDT